MGQFRAFDFYDLFEHGRGSGEGRRVAVLPGDDAVLGFGGGVGGGQDLAGEAGVDGVQVVAEGGARHRLPAVGAGQADDAFEEAAQLQAFRSQDQAPVNRIGSENNQRQLKVLNLKS